MKNILFSIIVPVYNVEKYLEQCIISILDQNFKDFELILINDKSTDSSLEICKKYAKNNTRIKLVENQKNIGLAGTRNEGMKVMQGQWVVFVDSDDFIKNNSFLENLYSQIKNSDCIFYGYSIFYEKTNECIKQHENISWTNNKIDKVEKIHQLFNSKNWYWSAWSHAYNVDFLRKHNIWFNANLRQVEDCEFFYKVMLHEPRITAIDDASYMYRRRANSLTDFSADTTKYALDVTLSTIELIYYSNLGKDYKNILLETLAYNLATTYLNIQRTLTGNEKKQAFKQLKKVSYIRKYATDKKSKTCFAFLKIFGDNIGSRILFKLNKVRNKKA